MTDSVKIYGSNMNPIHTPSVFPGPLQQTPPAQPRYAGTMSISPARSYVVSGNPSGAANPWVTKSDLDGELSKLHFSLARMCDRIEELTAAVSKLAGRP